MTRKTLSLEYIRERRKALKDKLADLDAAERLFNEMPSSAEPDDAPFSEFNRMRARRSARWAKEAKERPPIKEMILAILRDAGPKGQTSQEVLAAIRERWIADYSEKNVAPKLSLYKKDRLISWDKGKWVLNEAGEKELTNTKA